MLYKFGTRDEYPEKWAETQMNLAVAYRHRIQGDKAENLELAITANSSSFTDIYS